MRINSLDFKIQIQDGSAWCKIAIESNSRTVLAVWVGFEAPGSCASFLEEQADGVEQGVVKNFVMLSLIIVTWFYWVEYWLWKTGVVMGLAVFGLLFMQRGYRWWGGTVTEGCWGLPTWVDNVGIRLALLRAPLRHEVGVQGEGGHEGLARDGGGAGNEAWWLLGASHEVDVQGGGGCDGLDRDGGGACC